MTFKELVEEDKRGKQNFCYTIQNNGHIGIAPILNPRITKMNSAVIKIILDNGEELICNNPDNTLSTSLGFLNRFRYWSSSEIRTYSTPKTLLFQAQSLQVI